MMVGWRTAVVMTAGLVTDALAMAIFSRRSQLMGVQMHTPKPSTITYAQSNKAVLRRLVEPKQYTFVAHTQHVVEIHAFASVGCISSAYDSAMLTSNSGLCKTEQIRRQGPLRYAYGRASPSPPPTLV